MNLKNKVAVITGGAQGIGNELAILLTAAGCAVFIFDKALPANPLKGVKYFLADVTSEQQINNSFKKIISKIDILVNNAGVMRRGTLFDTSEADYDFVMDINLKGNWLVTKCARNFLSKKPVVLFMSSRHGMNVKPNPAIYCLSKHAVWGLAKMLKATCPEYMVKVAYPGSVDTALTWVGVKSGDVAAKKKTVVGPDYMAAKLLELIKGDREKLVFSEKTKRYTFA
jgi:3-oxoacyl-[acyl-carrier protein] reductase